MDLDDRPASRQREPESSTVTSVKPNTADADIELYVASQWRLMWWRFRSHRLALLSGTVLLLFYFVAVFVEPIAPYLPGTYSAKYTYAPPQRIHLFHNGRYVGPYSFGLTQEIEPEALRRVFAEDTSIRIPLGFFVRGDTYELWGLFESDIHLFGPVDRAQVVHLFGADRLGRDVLSRMIYGTRISLSIGLVGVALSFVLGTVLGGISGYYGGVVDEMIQRVIEFIRSIPTIPLWMALAAAVPTNWPPLRIYFAITLILSLIAWTGLARSVRGRFLSLREEDFVICARLDNASEMRVILRHMVPSFASHMIASLTLSIPNMILSETSLSFLGLGLQPPVVSWGVLLQEAQNIRAVSSAPWLLLPSVLVILTVLTLNFFGDGLRDAADPYSR